MFGRLKNWMMKRKAERVFATIRKQAEVEKQLGIAPSKEELMQEREEILKRLQELGVRTRRWPMTIEEAETILDVVSEALMDGDYPRPMSALHGNDVFRIDVAVKIHIAALREHLDGDSEWERKFSDAIGPLLSLPLHIITNFVPDHDFEVLQRLPKGSPEYRHQRVMIMPRVVDPQTKVLKDSRFAQMETPTSFAEFCKRAQPDSADYWDSVHRRIDSGSSDPVDGSWAHVLHPR